MFKQKPYITMHSYFRNKIKYLEGVKKNIFEILCYIHI